MSTTPPCRIVIQFGAAKPVLGKAGDWEVDKFETEEHFAHVGTERSRKGWTTRALNQILASRSYAGTSTVVLQKFHDDGTVDVFYGERVSRLTRFARITTKEFT